MLMLAGDEIRATQNRYNTLCRTMKSVGGTGPRVGKDGRVFRFNEALLEIVELIRMRRARFFRGARSTENDLHDFF